MNLLTLISGRWMLYGALIAALTLGIWRLDVSRQAIGYEKAVAKYTAAALKAEQAAQAQRDKQAADAAAAAAGYEKARAAWEKTLKVTKHDLYVSTQNLASCKLDAAAVRLLNDAGRDDAASP